MASRAEYITKVCFMLCAQRLSLSCSTAQREYRYEYRSIKGGVRV